VRDLVVHQAAYPYSGPIAASAYRQLLDVDHGIRKIVLLGPAHRVGFSGVGTHSAESFATPLGKVALDRPLLDRVAALPFVRERDHAFAQEHSLEVQLPFLQRTLDNFTLVPLLVGQCHVEEIAHLLRLVVDEEDSLILISTDLSHYLSYREAQLMDQATSAAIASLAPEQLGRESACGRLPLGGLLLLAKEQGWRVEVLDQRNSGDTAGSKSRVVGYGAYAFYA
jgi:AmmeMemoRadiSam system protein B